MAKKERFETIYSQGTIYVFRKVGNAGGMELLLGKDGKPVISPIAGN